VIENIARFAMFDDLPLRRIDQSGLRLGIDHAIRREMRSEFGQQFIEPTLVVRRINKDDIELLLVLAEKTHGILIEYLRLPCLQATLILLQCPVGSRRLFYKNQRLGATRQGLEAHGASTGKKVEADQAVHILPKPIEHGLPDTVRGRPQTRRIRKAQQAAAPLAAADAYLIRRLTGRFPTALCQR